MKEIWKAFSTACKEAWKNVADTLAKLFNDFMVQGKKVIVEILNMLQELIGNTMKSIETILMGLVLKVCTALFEALYDSVMYCFDWLKNLVIKK